jgi:uncharacterized caspase-like protein
MTTPDSRSLRWLAWMVLVLAQTTHAQNRNLQAQKSMDAPREQARLALIIGNAAYPDSPLRNPINDARAIAGRLRELGFDVIAKENLGRDEMHAALREFSRRLDRSGVGLFYFAGHGMQIKGRNYLIPVDAAIESEEEVPYRGVDAGEVLDRMEGARTRTNIVILDACRNNPFQRHFRSRRQGLAEMDAPSGTLIAFATAPGSVAADGEGSNGLYTKHLLEQIKEPLPVEQMFKRVRIAVTQETRDLQVPWESSSLKEDFFFRPGQGAALAAAPPAPEIHETVLELAFWDAVKNSTRAADYSAYLEQYPAGRFAALARVRFHAFAEPAPIVKPMTPQASPVAPVVPAPQAALSRPRREGATPPLLPAGVDVTAIAFSSDSRWLATASGDGKVQIFGAANGFALKRFDLDIHPTALGVSPDGAMLAVGTREGATVLLDVASGRERQRHVGHADPVVAAVFSPNGRYVLTASRGGDVLLRSARAAETVSAFRFPGAPIVDLQYAPDGRYFAIVQGGAPAASAKVVDVATGNVVYSAQASAASFSVNGRFLLVAAEGRSPTLIELTSGKELRRFSVLPADVVRGAYAESGAHVSTLDAGGSAVLWETRNGDKVAEMRVGGGGHRAVAFSPDARVLALVDLDGRLAIHRFREERP